MILTYEILLTIASYYLISNYIIYSIYLKYYFIGFLIIWAFLLRPFILKLFHIEMAHGLDVAFAVDPHSGKILGCGIINNNINYKEF
jgi:hypothetical protein